MESMKYGVERGLHSGNPFSLFLPPNFWLDEKVIARFQHFRKV